MLGQDPNHCSSNNLEYKLLGIPVLESYPLYQQIRFSFSNNSSLATFGNVFLVRSGKINAGVHQFPFIRDDQSCEKKCLSLFNLDGWVAKQSELEKHFLSRVFPSKVPENVVELFLGRTIRR